MAATAIDHANSLSKLCRVCGTRLPSDYVHLVSNSAGLFNTCFEIDITLENPNIHPIKYCHKCHRSMEHKMKGKCMNIIPIKWHSHQTNKCKSCELFNASKRGGRKPNKKGGMGRPKDPENLLVMVLLGFDSLK